MSASVRKKVELLSAFPREEPRGEKKKKVMANGFR